MKILIVLFFASLNFNCFAGGIHCKECPAETNKCLPKPNCKYDWSEIELNNEINYQLDEQKIDCQTTEENYEYNEELD